MDKCKEECLAQQKIIGEELDDAKKKLLEKDIENKSLHENIAKLKREKNEEISELQKIVENLNTEINLCKMQLKSDGNDKKTHGFQLKNIKEYARSLENVNSDFGSDFVYYEKEKNRFEKNNKEMKCTEQFLSSLKNGKSNKNVLHDSNLKTSDPRKVRKLSQESLLQKENLHHIAVTASPCQKLQDKHCGSSPQIFHNWDDEALGQKRENAEPWQSRLKELQLMIKERNKSIEELKLEKGKLTQRIQDLEKDTELQKQKMAEELKKSGMEIGQLRMDKKSLEHKIREAEDERRKCQARILELEEEIRHLENENSNLRRHISLQDKMIYKQGVILNLVNVRL